MGRRWMKLLVLALTVSHLSHQLLCIGFVGTSNVGDAQIRSLKIVRAASPVADGLGVASAVASLTDFFARCLNYYKQNLKQVAPLKQFDDADNHANRLFEKIEKSRSLIVPSLQGLPKQPIRDTKFTALMCEILRDTKTAGLSAVYAEPGVGKSVAVAVAIQAENSKSAATIALLQGNFETALEDFFRVSDAKRANRVAWPLFSLLRANNKRLHIIFDNTFDNGVDKTGMLMDLARAAFAHGHHIVAITQFKKSAEEIADLNGERTRLAPQQQQDDRTYRWSRRQAQKYLETMEEEMVSPNEPKEREEFIGKVLNNTLIPDDVGLWRPVAINEYMMTGHKPKAPQRARTSAPVWVRQLVKDDIRGFEFAGNAFRVKDKELQNIDDLKKAIKKEDELGVAASKIDIYLQQEDGGWTMQTRMGASLRETDEDDVYGYVLP